MEKSLTYTDPLIRFDHKFDLEAYRRATQLFEQGRFIESLNEFMIYANTDASKRFRTGPSSWVIPHGSLMVDIKVTQDGFFEVLAPFLKLPPEGRVALLRQVCEMNFKTLCLSQVILGQDQLIFYFRCPLALIDPFKIFAVLQEVCLNGDGCDDEFIEKFKAVALREKVVAYPRPETLERAWQLYQQLLDEGLAYDAYFTAKQWKGFACDAMGIALMKIDYAIAPQGYLRTEMEKSVQRLFAQKSLDEMIQQVREDLRRFKGITKEAFGRDIYAPTFFIHAKKSSDVAQCQKNLAKRFEWSTQDKSGGSSIGVTLNYTFAVYRLFYNYFVPEKMRNEIFGVLKSCSGKPWSEAADVMWNHFQAIMSPSYK